MDFQEFRNNLEKRKAEAYERAYFNLFLTQLPKGERPYDVDQAMLKASMYIIDRHEGKPFQKQVHSGDKENPIYFVPSELADKYGIRTTQKPETNSEGLT